MPVAFGTRPATDALARVEELARDGRLSQDDVGRFLAGGGTAHPSLLVWRIGTDGAPVLSPAPWLAAMISDAEVR